MAKLVPYEFDAPAHWTSALTNGDCSSFSDEDHVEFGEFCRLNPDHARDVVGCDDEPWIGRFGGLQCEMLTYQALGREGTV